MEILKISASNFYIKNTNKQTVTQIYKKDNYTTNDQKQFEKKCYFVCKGLKDPPEQLAGQMQLLLRCHTEVAPAVWEAVVLPATLIMIGQ